MLHVVSLNHIFWKRTWKWPPIQWILWMLPLSWLAVPGDCLVFAKASLCGVRERKADTTSHSWSPAEGSQGWMWVGICVPIGYVSGMACVNWKCAFHLEGKKGGLKSRQLLTERRLPFSDMDSLTWHKIRNSSEQSVRRTRILRRLLMIKALLQWPGNIRLKLSRLEKGWCAPQTRAYTKTSQFNNRSVSNQCEFVPFRSYSSKLEWQLWEKKSLQWLDFDW